MRSIVLLALLLSLVGRTALADPGAVIVSAGTKVADRDRSLAMTAASNRLRAAGWELVAKPLTAKEAEAVTTCLHNVAAWPCVSKIVGVRGIRQVASIALKRDQNVSGSPELVITGRLVLADVELVVLGKRYCEQCTDDTLTALTTELTTELVQQAALESGRTVLSIKSTPQGSIYSIDGVRGSATDATITVVPGTHVVTIEHDGYETETRTIEALEGKTAEVMITLRRLEPVGIGVPIDQKHEVTRRSRALPIALVAVGSAAIVGGLIAIASNQSDDRRPADQQQPRYYYDTITPGVTAVVAGVAIAGVGAYLWWKYSRADARASATVTAVDRGAVVGVQATF